MKRLLVVTPMMPPEPGGPGTYAAILGRELPALGVEVAVANYRDALLASPSSPKRALYARARELAAGADAVLALDPASVGPVAMLAARATGKPFFLRVPGDYAWEQASLRFGETRPLDEFVAGRAPWHPVVRALWWLERFVARRASRVIVPSEYLRRVVLAWGVADEKISVVGNAYDGATAAASSRLEARRAFSLPERGAAVVSAGRLVPWKGFAELVSTFAEVRRRHPAATLLIAGDGPERGAIERAIEVCGLGDAVQLLGALPKSRLAELLSAADLFVLNTRYEGLSHQILEAMALGAPVVTTAVGGNPEIVRDGETGWLVPYGDGAALGRAMGEALEDGGEAIRRATRARASVASMTPERVARETRQALDI